MDKQQLANLLRESQVPDTEKIKAITAELQKTYYAHTESLLLLIELIATEADSGVRQQAAIQAARLVPKHWKDIPKEQKGAVRQHLVQATLKEQDAKTRHADSRVIAAIANLDFDDGEWPELLPALFNLAANDNVTQREIGSYIIYSAVEANPTHFEDDLAKLLQLFSHTIRDPQSADVRVNTMMSIGAILMLIEPEEDEDSVQALQGLIPPMVDVLKDAVQSNDEEKATKSFEIFQQFLAYESALIGGYLKDLVQFMIDLAANAQADDEIRSQAIAFLTQAVRYRRMKIQGIQGMGAQLTLKSMGILTEIDDDEDEDETTPATSALALLDELSTDLPPRQVVVPLLDAFPSFATSEDAGKRKAGILALGTVCEGAPEFVATQIKPMMRHILNLLNDPDAGVRHTALVGVSRLAEDIAEELGAEHEALMTALVKNLQAAVASSSDGTLTKKNAGIIRSVCTAVDSLAEGMEPGVMKPYAPKLVETIAPLINYDDLKVKVASAGALSAIAGSLGQDFKPFFEDTIHALAPYVARKESEDDLALRSGICDALGRVATAVGPEMFQPYVVDLMNSSQEALHLDNSRLRESSFMLWSALAKVYEAQFATFLPAVFEGLFESLELEEEEFTLNLTDVEKAIVAEAGDVISNGKKIKVRDAVEVDEANEMDEDDEDEDWEDALGVSTEALEKEVAMEVMGDIITHACGQAEVQLFLEKAVTMITPLAEHSYEGCRKAAVCTLWRAYARVWQLWEEETGVEWEPGLPPKQTPSPTLIKLADIVTKATLQLWAEEADRAVVTEINRNVAATLKACGPSILSQDNMLQQTITVVGTLITRSHPCQQDLGDDEDEQDVEGSSEFDWLIIDTALDVVIGLAAALGTSFVEVWKIFEKPILKFASSTDDEERATAVGVIAECAGNMKEAITPYTSKILNLLLKRLSDTHMEAKSNAAYAVGQLIYNSTDSATYLPAYETILQKLEPMMHQEGSRIRDNAAGCVARMIMAHPEHVPIGQVLPALVSLLPLKEDYEENKPVYEVIYKLYESNEPTVQQLTPKLIPVFEQVLGPPEDQLDDETRLLLHRTVQILYKAKPELFQGHEVLVNHVNAS